MAKKLKTTLTSTGRWILWILAAAAIAVLAGGLETGRVHAANTAFTFLGALSNVVTPNGDALNDKAILCYDNPRFSEVSGTIYDLRGNKVSDMSRAANAAGCSLGSAEKLEWDARAGGQTVAGGIYIYQVQSEGTTITGTVMVVR